MSIVRTAGLAGCLIFFLSACNDESTGERPFSTEQPQGGSSSFTEAPDASYSFCVSEAEWFSGPRPEPTVCEFEGTRKVAFGANGQFFYTEATDGIDCTSSSFEGDPASGTRKACFLAPSSSAPAEDNDSSVSSIASSTSSISSSSSSSVTSSSSSERAVSVPVPVPPVGVTPTTEGPSSEYTFCVNEAEWLSGPRPDATVCEFDGTREVAFGANGQFHYKTASGRIACSSNSFEQGDPISGTRKACFVANSTSAASPGDGDQASAPSSSSASSASVPSTPDAPTPSAPEDEALSCDTPKPSALSAEYGENCSGCHGEQGLGNSSLDIANLVEAEFEALSAFEQPIRNGKGFMPVFSEDDYPLAALQNDFAYLNHDAQCGGDSAPVQVSGSCAIRDELLEPQLRRLTQTQLVNTITTVFGDQFDPSIWPDLGDGIPTVGMSNNANMLQIDIVNLERIHATVSAVIEQLLASTVSECVASSNTGCIDNLLIEYAPQLWRRPLTDRELADLTSALITLRGEQASRGQQVEFVFRSLLMSPNFLFRMELGNLQDSALHLDSYEIASLLSYALWDGPPDNTLYQLASTDQLTDQAVIDQQVDRMIEDPRFSGAMVGFFKDFLKLDRVLTTEKMSELEFTESQRRDLLTSAELMLARGIADVDADLMAIFQGDQFYVNNNIAPFFGLNSRDFGSEFTFTSVSSNERSGILTHPAFLAVHATAGTSGIVKRGVFTLEQMLCVHLGAPPDDLTEAELPTSIDPLVTSSRELLHLQHSSQPNCAGCHRVIDPAGFGFEHYDVLGRYRTVEKNVVPIDASGELANVVNQPLVFSNSVEYVRGLVEAPEMRSCVNRRMLESFSGQRISANACELEQLNQFIDQDDTSIRGLIRSLTQLESVRLRTQ